MMSEPNGVRDNLAILKNCIPKGIPTIVIHQRSPKITFSKAIHIPKKISHKILPIIDTTPPPYLTSFLNGKNDKEANLKHCNPIGIPIIVIQQIIPARTHDNPLKNPPNKNHNILPTVRIYNLLIQL